MISNEIGGSNSLEAIIPAAVADLSVRSIHDALASLGLDVPLYISQNDGTLMDAEFASRFPVLTISSSPTNSMQGAAFLSGVRDGIVADVGGTSTDVGALVKGFPREAAVEIEIAGASRVLRPEHAEVANSVGAAIAQVGGQVERVYSLEETGREGAIADCRAAAFDKVVAAGGDASSIEVVEIDEVPLTHVPSNATLVRVKAVGNLTLAEGGRPD